MSIPIAAVMPIPIVNAGKGAYHQRVRAEATSVEVPSFFVLSLVASDMAGGVVGTAYTETITALGGTPPYSFALTSGAMPTGLSINATTGVVSGTPTTPGTSTFTIRVTDASLFTGSQIFSITIVAAPTGGGGTSNSGWIS